MTDNTLEHYRSTFTGPNACETAWGEIKRRAADGWDFVACRPTAQPGERGFAVYMTRPRRRWTDAMGWRDTWPYAAAGVAVVAFFVGVLALAWVLAGWLL